MEQSETEHCEWPDCEESEDLRLCSTTDGTLWLCRQCRKETHNIKVGA